MFLHQLKSGVGLSLIYRNNHCDLFLNETCLFVDAESGEDTECILGLAQAMKAGYRWYTQY